MRRPSFQFYPADWSASPNLKRCSFAERGIWIEVMCLMHDQSEYGVLRWSLKEIANAVGCKTADLMALVRKGVLKGDDERLAEAFVYVPRSGRKDGEPVTLIDTQAGPIWYSSRMVKDEHVRTIRGDSGVSGEASKAAPKAASKAAPKPPIGEAFGPRDARTRAAPSSSSSSSSSIHSEAIASATAAPPRPPPPSARDVVYGLGLPMLMAASVPEERGRNFLGLLLKVNPEQDVADAVQRCAAEAAMQPIAYLQGCLKTSAAKASKHGGFAAKNYRDGVTEDGTIAL